MRILLILSLAAMAFSAFAQQQEPDPIQRLGVDVPAYLTMQGHVIEDMNTLMSKYTAAQKQIADLTAKVKELENQAPGGGK
jgi:hypothetical protein